MKKRTGEVRPVAEIPKTQRRNFSKPFRKGTTVDLDGLTWVVDGWKKGRLVLNRPKGAKVLPTTRKGQVVGVLGMNMRVKSITPTKVYLVLMKDDKVTKFNIPELIPDTRDKIAMLNDPTDTWYAYINTHDETDIRFLQIGPLRTMAKPPRKYPEHDLADPARNMVFVGKVDMSTWEVVPMTWEEAGR